MVDMKTSMPRLRMLANQVDLFKPFITLDGCSLDVISSSLGYFKPNVTGIWTFKIFSDGLAYFWIGDVALKTYSTSNVVVSKTDHAGAGWINVQVSLNAGVYYPLRFLYVNLDYSCAAFQIGFIPPNTAALITDFTGFAFAPNSTALNSTWELPLDLSIPYPVSTTVSPQYAGLNYFRWDGSTWLDSAKNMSNLAKFKTTPTANGTITELSGPGNVGIVGGCSSMYESAMIIGYFKPKVTGVWGIRGQIVDVGHIWIGDVALDKFNGTNSLIAYPIYGWKGYHFYAEAGKYYPIRAVQGNNLTCVCFRIVFSEPNKFGTWSTRPDLLFTDTLPNLAASGWTLPPK
jgi:hypothetical protein